MTKARVKETGEIIELCNMEFDEDGNDYYRDELELIGDYEPDYWDKLHHQAAIAAMQGILSNPQLIGLYEDDCAAQCLRYAKTLVNKLKEDKQCEK